MAKPVRVGVIGCGNISGQYLGMSKNFSIVDMAACADLNMDVAKAKAAEFNIAKVMTVDEMFADPSIEVILNLTVPKAHAEIALKALEAGKHTYAEKPFTVTREDGKAILKKAKQKKLLVGCAPDTFMGAGIQTARKVLDDGLIGKPVAFTAVMMCIGHEAWHPSPEFYYEVGGGPMFDMGPYYLTALLNLLGPVKRQMGLASVAIPERTITSKPKFGKKVKVETPDHIIGSLEFEQGAVGSLITSFATMFAPSDNGTPIIVYGDKGVLQVPDPNGFGGPVRIRKVGEKEWTEVPLVYSHKYGRSVGLADMAYAIRSGRPFRANGDQAFAVLDLMQGFLDSSTSGKAYKPVAKYERPGDHADEFAVWRVGRLMDV